MLEDPEYARAEYASAWNNKGTALANLGRYDEAIRCYDRALEIDPKDADVWKVIDNLGRYDEAMVL
ncbi:MAG: tetratricopeptide repeat protein [Methanoculleus sp.]